MPSVSPFLAETLRFHVPMYGASGSFAAVGVAAASIAGALSRATRFAGAGAVAGAADAGADVGATSATAGVAGDGLVTEVTGAFSAGFGLGEGFVAK